MSPVCVADIDECEEQNPLCPQNLECLNTPGSFICSGWLRSFDDEYLFEIWLKMLLLYHIISSIIASHHWDILRHTEYNNQSLNVCVH